MSRRLRPEIRAELLETCTDHALQHGLPDRLEPFAGATGASTRMLLHHFGSKEALLRAVLERARERQLARWGLLLRSRPGVAYTEVLAQAWAAMTGPAEEPYLRMFDRLRQSTEQQLWPGFRRLATTDWLAPLEEGLRSMGRPELATLVLAAIRGLLMDLDATGDRVRADAAFQQFLTAIDPGRALA